MTYKNIFEKLHPENSIGGECGLFAHKLINFPLVGNTIINKIQAVNNYGIRANLLNQAFRLGDVVIIDVKTLAGHVAVINTIDFNSGLLTLTESNFHLDQRVHHTRQINISDQSIIGMVRGTPLFNVPTVNYPLVPKVAVIFNNQGPWANQNQFLNQIRDWFFKNSGGKLQMQIEPYFSSYSNIPTVATGGGTGLLTEVIDENWYNQHICGVYYGHHIYIFVMKPEDFKGQVYNANGLLEYGYAFEPHFPIKTFIACNENTNFPPDYPDPDLQGFAKFAVHEISHGLYGICPGASVVPGGDYTHNRFYGLNGKPMNPPDIFNDLDLSLLNQKIN